MRNRIQRVLGVFLSFIMLCSRALALGTASYSNELISTRSLGQGGTGVAGTQNDPIVGYMNPAGLTGLAGTQVTVGGTYLNASPTFTNDQGQVTGARATSVSIPNFGVSTPLMDGKLAVGLALVSPYGLDSHFDGDSPLRYAATDSRLHIADITPSVAYKVCDAFSIGAGVDYYNTLEGELEKKVDTAQINGDEEYAIILGLTHNQGDAMLSGSGAAKASTDANFRLNGTGDGWGYHVGTTVRPNEHNQIGIVYHSSVKIGLTGNVQLTGLNGLATGIFGGNNFSTNVSAPLFMPQNVQIGYAYMPNDHWQFEADAAWYDWYSARQLGIVYDGLIGSQNAVLNTWSPNPQVFNPRNTINFGIGANYKQSNGLQLRGGAYYQAASLPESAFDPAFVDLPRYSLTFGVGYSLTKNLGLDLAYEAVFFHSRHITAAGDGDPFANNVGYSGYFNSFANVASASLSYRTNLHL